MADSAEFAVAYRRCKEIAKELRRRKQHVLNVLLSSGKVYSIELGQGVTGFYIPSLKLVLQDGNEVVIKSGHGCIEDNLDTLDPDIKQLKGQLTALNKKHHIFV